MSSFLGRIKSGAGQVAGKAAFEADKLRRIAAEQSAIKGLKDEVEKLMKVATNTMARAPLPVVQLNVPLVVEAKAGQSWAEAH